MHEARRAGARRRADDDEAQGFLLVGLQEVLLELEARDGPRGALERGLVVAPDERGPERLLVGPAPHGPVHGAHRGEAPPVDARRHGPVQHLGHAPPGVGH